MSARRLVLVRHAKSLQDGPPARTDVLRPLNDRGEREAPLIGIRLAAEGIRPDRVVVSPAQRTRQTWSLASAEMTGPPSPVVDERIYDNSVSSLLAVIASTATDVGTLVLVGHNPSISELAALASPASGAPEGDDLDPGQRLDGFATGTVAVLSTDAQWPEISPDLLVLQSIWSPKI